MKKIKSTVTYRVPSWNFCNVDKFDIDASVPKELCRFCQKSKDGYRCLLYDQSLSANSGLVNKAPQCCDATAGFASDIELPELPTIPPRDLMSQAIEMYDSTVKGLVAQGYPRQMAEAAAKKHILGG